MLVSLGKQDGDRAGALLGRAFIDDPIWTAAFANPEERPARLRTMFAALVKTTIAAGGLVEATADIGAVAVWLPPGKDLGLMAQLRSGLALPRLVIGMPASDRKRMVQFLRQVDGRRRELMPEPHWYLSAIGVDPERQGTGLGSMLVEAGMERARHEGKSVYLETETTGNVAFYERLEFQVIEEIEAVGIGVPIWLMRWDAGPE